MQVFRTIEDKSSVINQNTGVDKRLTKMIKNCLFPRQKIAVGNPEYKKIIKRDW